MQVLLGNGTNDAHYSLLSIDLDRFGYVNHFIGFIEGDTALATLTRAVAGAVPTDVFFARVGSDEFALIVPDEADGRRGARLAGQLLDVVRESLQFLATDAALSAMSTKSSPFTASIGVVVFGPGSSHQLEELMREAAERVAFAKRCGRNRVWAEAVPLKAHC